ncbi:UDP-N-acetylmuramoyl-L-alanine--D-glutamate ligase, partial [Haemophilus influenzae HK1212]
LRIYHNAEVGVLNNEDKLTFGEGENQAKHTVSFAENSADYWLKTENGKQYLMVKDEVILPCEEATLVGRHNYMNILAATALAQAIGINLDSIRTALRHFKGLDHRFQLVHQANGIRWINDSKATNVGSTVAALAGLYIEGKLHLLLGGDGKGADFSELAE